MWLSVIAMKNLLTQRFRKPLLLFTWALAVAGILHAEPLLAQVVGDGHSVCGFWGCGPPLKSIIVWHGFVACVVVPAAAWLAHAYPVLSFRVGGAVLWTVVISACVFIAANTTLWWWTASPVARGFVLHRALFSTVAFSDVPVWPLLAAAIAFRFAAGRFRRASLANDHGSS